MGGPLLQAQNWAALASVPPRAQLTKLPLRTDMDAPFLLRSIACRVQYDNTLSTLTPGSSHRQTGLNQVLFRFTTANGQYMQQYPVPILLLTPFAGQMGNPLPMQRQVFYPAGSTIQVDVINNGPATLTNLTFYFRGVKMWPWSVRRWYPYPSGKLSTLPYAYAFGQSPIEFPQLYNVPVTQPFGTPIRLQLNFKQDGDFVLRSLQAGPQVPPGLSSPSVNGNFCWEVFFRLHDGDDYPYSNDFIQADVMCGNAQGPASFPTGVGMTGPATSFLSGFDVGPALPGVIFPEVYIPNNQFMWLDVARNDSSFVGMGAIAQDFPVVFQGSKVYQVS